MYTLLVCDLLHVAFTFFKGLHASFPAKHNCTLHVGHIWLIMATIYVNMHRNKAIENVLKGENARFLRHQLYVTTN